MKKVARNNSTNIILNKQMNDSVIFDEQLPDPKKYWDLFQTTGWNLEYNFSIQDLAN